MRKSGSMAADAGFVRFETFTDLESTGDGSMQREAGDGVSVASIKLSLPIHKCGEKALLDLAGTGV